MPLHLPLHPLLRSPAQVALVLVWLTLGACAGKAGKPIVDMKGVNPYQYEQDLAECSDYADEVPVGEKAVTGAAAGAAVGAAVGVIWDGHRGSSPERGAATGAVVGGAGGVGSGISERNRVVKNCLRGRGYAVLN
jgi:hypothetical protein